MTVGLFLRELRGVWPGATPPLDDRAADAARHLHLIRTRAAGPTLAALGRIATDAGLDLRDPEGGLVRLALAHHGATHTCPGVYSMPSFGFAVAGTFDGTTFTPLEPESATFYRELRPISDQWQPEYLAASHLDRERLLLEGADPAVAITEAAAWVRQLAGHRRPVPLAWPLAFDWSYLYWYFERFGAAGSPFGFDACLDMKTMYQQKADLVIELVAKRCMPPPVLPTRQHTRHGPADAVEQAELFANLFTWRRRVERRPPTRGRVGRH